jgi:hypothetical protein
MNRLPWGLALIGAMVAVGCVNKSLKSQKRSAVSVPAETDQEVLRRETKTTSPYAASEIISKQLRTPTEAQFTERTLVESQDNFALVSVIVEAPNSFGVKLHQTWCTIIRFEPPRGARYVWHQSTGAWECSAGIDPKDLLVRKVAIEWPGAAGALMDYLVKPGEREEVRVYATKMSKMSGFSETDLHRWLGTFFFGGGTVRNMDQFVAAVLDVSSRYEDHHQGAVNAAAALGAIYSNNRASDDDLVALKVKKRTGRTREEVLSAIAGPSHSLGAAFFASASAITK